MNPFQGLAVAVLGASGFVGRWVARALCRAGARTYCLVRNPGEAARVLGRHAVAGELVPVDLLAPAALLEIFARIRPVITFNLAGYGVDPSEKDDRTGLAINVEMIPFLCQALAPWRDPAWPGQHLVHVGSAAEYGALRGVVREDAPADPTTWYGRTKLLGTHQVIEACTALGIRGVTARLFSVYGPGEHEGRLLPTLCRAAASGARIPLTAGLQKRDFTYVEDVAEGLLRIGLASQAPYQILNLATGRLVSVRRFVNVAARILGLEEHQLGFDLLPGRPQELQHGRVSLEWLRQTVGWAPATRLAEGIRRTGRLLSAEGSVVGVANAGSE